MVQEPMLLDTLNERELEIIPLLEAGLSNKEIANQLYLAPNTVKWYVKQLNSKLDTSNRHEIVERVAKLGLLDKQTEDILYSRPRQNLPRQTTPFIGRDAELDEIHAIIEKDEVRLLTILAQGGMGKTRIALEASEQQLNRFPDGVYFVALQALSDVNNIVPQIATSTGFQFSNDGRSQKEQLLDFLANKTMLLCIDNWEHLLDGVDLLNEILQSAPDVKILATSREKLNLLSETVYVLQGMQYPDWETPEDALEYDAVQLLLQSANRVKPDWEVTQDNLDYVARVCRLTQGMPLGILLATSWLDVYSLDRICDEIQNSVDILETEMRDVPERQRSIRAIFAYSWERLNPKERDAFMKMSVFRGGCTPQAVEAITGANARILQSLVNKALLLCNREGRYDVHELLRQYAGAELEQSGEMDNARNAHAIYYADMVKLREGDLIGAKQIEALAEIAVDSDNVQVAWNWAIEEKRFTVNDSMLIGLGLFCLHRARLDNYASMLSEAVKKFSKDDLQITKQAWGRLLAQYAPFADVSYVDKLKMVEEATSIARNNQDKEEIIRCNLQTAQILTDKYSQVDQISNELDRVWTLLGEALDLSRQLGLLYQQRCVLSWQGYILAAYWERMDEAELLCSEALQISRQIENTFSTSHELMNLGVIALVTGKVKIAETRLMESLDWGRKLGDPMLLLNILSNITPLKMEQGHYEDAYHYTEQCLDIARDASILKEEINALLGKANLLGLQGQYDQQLQIVNEAKKLWNNGRDQLILGEIILVEGSALCGLKQFAKARKMLFNALEILQNSQKLRIPYILFPICLVLVYEDGQFERALSILSLAHKHNSAFINWYSNAIISEFKAYLESVLTQEEYDIAWEHGKSLDLETVVQELIAEFGGKETQLPE